MGQIGGYQFVVQKQVPLAPAEAHYANGMYDRAIEIEEDLIRRGLGPVDFFRQQLEKFRQAREASEP